MSRSDHLVMIAGATGVAALALMLGRRLISPTRFAQALAAGLVSLGLARLALALSGTDHV
ncbi:hypothetical protein [Brevundimonas sp.]|uniref:hypothetical protein n=1 Tax=Brevundimonas sp. TaxID=1871086 RepID=UPI001A32DF49|nr:hypothetical protein [Brevundimonas sp.]MBJ7483479.1 hypothetical protein [Brevundimonas sp.]